MPSKLLSVAVAALALTAAAPASAHTLANWDKKSARLRRAIIGRREAGTFA